MLEKGDVNGKNAHPLFKFLKAQAKFESIGWNFGKFLVNAEGQVIEYDGPMTKAKSLEPKIKEIIGA